jgi:hypothetical protein
VLISEIDGLSPLENPASKGFTMVNLRQQKDINIGKNPSFFQSIEFLFGDALFKNGGHWSRMQEGQGFSRWH